MTAFAKRGLFLLFATLFILPLSGVTIMSPSAYASDIRYVVNRVPITSYDIDRRVAFLKLQRQRGDLRKKAADALIEQALKSAEMKRLRIATPQEQVDAAFGRFASQNKLSASQLSQVLAQAGVTSAHFKEFIRIQIGWNSALSRRFQADGQANKQDVVQRMLQQGGNKPSATEYRLQQVIFVVPGADRKKILNKRKREADAMRQRFSGCDSTRQFAKGLIDVTVRDLGRVLEPELPGGWADMIKASRPGQATKTRVTDRGVEFIGICSAREVSDDRVAEILFNNEGDLNEKASDISNKYVAELRKKAQIVKR